MKDSQQETIVKKALSDIENTKQDLKEELSDASNAELFAELYGDKVRYDHKMKRWLILNDTSGIWEPDIEQQVNTFVKTANRTREQRAYEIQDGEKRRKIINWAISSNSYKQIRATVELAKSEYPLSDPGDKWDIAPLLLGCPNGVIDLSTGELRKGRPEDRVTMTISVPFDDKANCDRWEKFLDEVFEPLADKDEVVHWLQMALGYSLTRSMSEQIVFFCYGGGSNGKSVMFSTLLSIFGSYGQEVAPTLLQETNSYNTSTLDLIALENMRFAISSETLGGQKINAGRLKQLSGGDLVTARGHFEKFRSFQPCAKLWLFTNDKPVIEDDSFAMWRRIRAIPFLRTFKGDDADPELGTKLRSESAGILKWLIEGCLMWQQETLRNIPKSIQEAISDYQKESDPLTPFLEDNCTIGEGLEESASVLYAMYDAWATKERIIGKEKLSPVAFGKKMSMKFEKVHKNTGWKYLNVSLKTGETDESVTGLEQSLASENNKSDELIPDSQKFLYKPSIGVDTKNGVKPVTQARKPVTETSRYLL